MDSFYHHIGMFLVAAETVLANNKPVEPKDQDDEQIHETRKAVPCTEALEEPESDIPTAQPSARTLLMAFMAGEAAGSLYALPSSRSRR